MSHQMNPLMFWLEQEPVINSEEAIVFLPADTPTDNTLNKYNYQLGKKAQLRKHRTLERLRAYEFEKIAKRRRTPHAQDVRPRPLVKLEVIKGGEFLNTHKDEFMELFQMTEKYQKGDQIVNTAKYPESEICLEIRNSSFVKDVQTKSANVIAEHEKEFDRLKSELYREGRNHGHHPHITSNSPSSTLPIGHTNSPPHPPRMSSRDPRSFMADPRRPQQ